MLSIKNPETNEYIPINVTKFPDKTSQVWKTYIPDTSSIEILWNFEKEEELIHLAQLKDLVENKHVILNVPFLPYSRQDKPITNQSTFALNTFGRLLNSLYFHQVLTYDVHNPEAANSYVNNLYNELPVFKSSEVTYVLPDAGANRYLCRIPFDSEVITCEKHRNQSNGHIEFYKINGNVKDKNVIVIDDIVDGGKTFEILGQNLKEQGVKSARLHVSHGIFSKGTLALLTFYDRITCVNRIGTEVLEGLEIINKDSI